MSRHSCTLVGRAANRGSVLAAALALVFLIFSITSISLVRSATLFTQARTRHQQTVALFAAEAGIQKAAAELLANAGYSGEKGTQLATGSFDVAVRKAAQGYTVTSTGYAKSAFKQKPRMTVRARVVPSGEAFRILDWSENP